jgi:hypothetical protein
LLSPQGSYTGNPTINATQTFCKVLGNVLPESQKSFTSLLKSMDDYVKTLHPLVTQGALNKVHGDWYEWLISISANNYCLKKHPNKRLLQLPNVTQFDVSKLYTRRLSNYISDLRKKVNKSSGVSLITSNPDFVIVDTTNIQFPQITHINNFDKTVIQTLQNSYLSLVDQCELDDIIGYLSVKVSLRPDRRLQLSHEGSLMKALYVHMQTRDWLIAPKGLRYYAGASKLTAADINGLRTVATHSITNVQSVPDAAVDKSFVINSIDDVEKALDDTLS